MKKTLFNLIFILVCLGIFEGVLRFFYPLPEISNFNRIDYQILDQTSAATQYLRNKTMLWKSFPDTNYAFKHKLNLYGYRDKEWTVKKAKDYRVFVLGDSFVEGMMSTQERSIPSYIQQMAKNEGKSWEVFNCGMMGIGLNEYMKFVADAVPIFQPDHLVMVIFANDMPFMRPYVPSTQLQAKFNSSFKPRLLSIIQGLRADNPIPNRFSSPEESYYKAVPDPGNPWTFKAKDLAPHVKPNLAEAMKRGELNFFRTNWFPNEAKFLSASIDIGQKIQFIKNYCDQNHAKLSIFYVPSRLQVSDYYYQFEKQYCQLQCPDKASLMGEQYQVHAKILAQTCKNLNILYQDLTPHVRDEEQKGNHLYWNYDDHMRSKGYALLAQWMYAAVSK